MALPFSESISKTLRLMPPVSLRAVCITSTFLHQRSVPLNPPLFPWYKSHFLSENSWIGKCKFKIGMEPTTIGTLDDIHLLSKSPWMCQRRTQVHLADHVAINAPRLRTHFLQLAKSHDHRTTESDHSGISHHFLRHEECYVRNQWSHRRFVLSDVQYCQ